MIRKPVIEGVITSEETLAALKSKLKKSYVDKHRIIRNHVGGLVVHVVLVEEFLLKN